MSKLYIGAAIGIVAGVLAVSCYIKRRVTKTKEEVVFTSTEPEIQVKPKKENMKTRVSIGPAEVWSAPQPEIRKWISTPDGQFVGIGWMSNKHRTVGIITPKVKYQGAIKATECTTFEGDRSVAFMNGCLDAQGNIICLGTSFHEDPDVSIGIVVKFDEHGKCLNNKTVGEVSDLQFATVTDDEIICVGNTEDAVGVITFDSNLNIIETVIGASRAL